MKWKKGEATIDLLIANGELEEIHPDLETAQSLLTAARRHIRSAHLILEDGEDQQGGSEASRDGESPAEEARDLDGALGLAYDAARKASAALLQAQGLRATSQGGHVAVLRAVTDQFNGPSGNPAFARTDQFRRMRNDSEYPSVSSATAQEDDVKAALEHAVEIVDAANSILETGMLGPYR